MHAQLLQSCLTLCDLGTVAHQAPPSMGFSRHEYWSGLPCLPLKDLPNPRTEPTSLATGINVIGINRIPLKIYKDHVSGICSCFPELATFSENQVMVVFRFFFEEDQMF